MENTSAGNKLRIYILTSEDPLYSNILLEKLLTERPGEVVGMAFCGGMFSFKRLFYSPFIYGPFRFLKLCLQIIKGSFTGGKIEQLCKKHGVPL